MSRVDDVPCYAQRDDHITARLYNLWRRARLHFPCPMHIELEAFPGMVMILDSDEWVCADARQNELPVLAWVEFEDKGRAALHEAVNCRLNYYHFAASRMRAQALAEMEQVLERRLHNDAAGVVE